MAELRTPRAGHGPVRRRLCVIIAIALLSASPIHAQVIGIDCTGDLSASGGLDPVQSTDIMGVVPQQNWNSTGEGVESGSLSAVIDGDGNVLTGVSATWSFFGDGWSQNDKGVGADPVDKNHRLMQGLLWTNSTAPGTFAVSGLEAAFGVGVAYNVIVYMDAWTIDTPPSHVHSVQLNAESPVVVTLDADYSEPDPAFDDASDGAGNYLVFPGVVGDSFTLTLLAGIDSQAWLNGVQIVRAAPPQPAADRIALSLTGDLDLAPIAATDLIGIDPQVHWNTTGFDVEIGALTGLIGASGFFHAGVTATWNFNGDGTSQNVPDATPEPIDPNHKLMQGLLWDDTTSATLTMSGLQGVYGPGGLYDVILYMDAWAIGTPPHDQRVQLNGQVPVTVVMDADYSEPDPAFENASFDGSGNYYRFTSVSGDAFTVTLHPGVSHATAWLNGVQVVPTSVPVPALGPPALVGLIASLSAASAWWGRRRGRASPDGPHHAQRSCPESEVH